MDALVLAAEPSPASDVDRKSFLDEPLPPSPPPPRRGREPLVWGKGWGPFAASFKARLKDIFTLRFVLAAVAGQVVSLAITATTVETTELVNRNWANPTTQTFFLYLFLALIYTPLTVWRYGFKAWARMVVQDGWKYFVLAAVDVEGNYTVVKAYQYSDLLSCELLDAWATPVCMVVAYFLVKARYHWSQILGVLICILGLGLLVLSDFKTDKNYPAANKPLGDGLMILGATLYGVSNGLQEFLVRQRPLYEVVGQLGFWGTLINGVQAAALEHNSWKSSSWNGATIGILVAYTVSMLCLYTLAPIIFRLASSPFYNVSILSSDFFGLCFGLGLYHYRVYWLYFVAYVLVLLGLVVYFSCARPEDQGDNNVIARGKQAVREAERRARGERIRIAGET